MITTAYLLMTLTGLLVAAGAVIAFRNRGMALALVGMALVAGVAAAIVAMVAINRRLPPAAYQAVRAAAMQDDQVDAAAQWALGDNVISQAEFGEISTIYRERTGKSLADLMPSAEKKR